MDNSENSGLFCRLTWDVIIGFALVCYMCFFSMANEDRIRDLKELNQIKYDLENYIREVEFRHESRIDILSGAEEWKKSK